MLKARRSCGLAIVFVAVAALAAGPAQAARHWRRHSGAHHDSGPVKASIVIDAKTGVVLSESNADALTYPASLTKMMTLYLTFEALNSGHLRLDQRLPVSAYAASRPPTKLGLHPGGRVRVRNLILGIVTRSANDAAVVLAEGIAGSESAFARMMNAEAARLGMTRTHYDNASGLPDPHQVTTARDEAQLALALYHHFPREYHYFSTEKFDFRGRTIFGHDALLRDYPGADGIKTGYIHASGFNLVTSAVRHRHRLIGVVLGGHTAATRDAHMERLLNRSFASIGVGSVAAARRASAHVHTVRIARAAVRFAARLSPIARADAAPLAHHSHVPVLWGIQLGAFRNEAAARRSGREAGTLASLRHKPLRIFYYWSDKKDRPLYRARVLGLTERQAIRACTVLHRHRRDCWAIHPAVRFASR